MIKEFDNDVDKIVKELGKELKEANKYVEDLKCLERRMDFVKLNDKVFFLKRDIKSKKLWNCGHANVISIINNEELTKLSCPAKHVKQVYLKSESYPFYVIADPEDILKNWTDGERRIAKEENKDE